MAVKNSTRRIKLFENYIIMSRLYTFMKVIDENLNTIVLTISKNRWGSGFFVLLSMDRSNDARRLQCYRSRAVECLAAAWRDTVITV